MDQELDKTPLEIAFAKALQDEPGGWTPDCLTPDQLEGIVRQGVQYSHAESLLSHAVDCPFCRRELAEMRRLVRADDAVASRPSGATAGSDTVVALRVRLRNSFRTRPVQAVFAGVVLLAVCLWQMAALIQRRHAQEALVKPPHPSLPFHNIPNHVAQIGAGDFPKMMHGAAVEGGSVLPAFTSVAVAAFMGGSPGVSRAATTSAGPTIQMIRPAPGDMALRDTHPEFEWHPVEDLSQYEARLAEAVGPAGPFKELPQVLAVKGATARLVPGVDLQRGHTYRLTVRGIPTPNAQDPEEATASYRYVVLSDTQLKQVDWAEANLAKAPVTSVILLYQSGLYTEAMAALKVWPKNKKLDPWAEAIRAAYQDRLSDPDHLP